MKLRWKLAILLLAIALVPLIASSVLHRVSTRRLGRRLASQTRAMLAEQARVRLQTLVDNYGRILHRDRNLLKLAVQTQAREVERRLAAPPPERPGPLYFARDIDGGVRMPEGMAPSPHHLGAGPGGAPQPMSVSYRHQAYFLVGSVDRRAVADALNRLSTMPEVYRFVYGNMPEFLRWQYTALACGVHTSFPAHGGYPEEYDPRKRSWYRKAVETGQVVWMPPIIDASTRQAMFAVAAPVRGPDGRIVGVTGIDVPVEGIFSELELPAQWSADEASLFVHPVGHEGSDVAGKLAVIARKHRHPTTLDWRRPLVMEYLTSDDPNELEALKADAIAGRSGVRRMPYNGQASMWAHGAAAPDRPFPVVIVPYHSVVAHAEAAERYALEKTIEGLQVTGVILLGVIGLVVATALLSSRSVTRPIDRLAEAAGGLAAGDYDAKADVRTRDELQQLAEVFNDVGPKLREREGMKRSLALAMEIQQHLLPQEPPRLDGFDIAGKSLYCDEIGGDYYDFIDLVDLEAGKLGIAVGDVTGHGIGAALLMASARAVLRSHAGRHGTDLGRLMSELNTRLVRDTGGERFMTLFYGELDGPTRSLWWASGGHDPPLWLRRASGLIEQLPNTGMLLGVIEGARYGRDGPITIDRGDVIVIGTDGIWEAANADGEMFGKQRLGELLTAAADRPAAEIHEAIVDAVGRFHQPAAQADDITLVVIKAL